MARRLSLRLDAEQRQRLDEIARTRGVTISDAVRDLIDAAWDADQVEYRRQLVREMAAMQGEVPDDPQDLFRELESRYDDIDLP